MYALIATQVSVSKSRENLKGDASHQLRVVRAGGCCILSVDSSTSGKPLGFTGHWCARLRRDTSPTDKVLAGSAAATTCTQG